MAKLTIQGRKTISGMHRVSGNKNAALPMIAASLLTSEQVTISNLPDIADVASMLEAAKHFGVRFAVLHPNSVTVPEAEFDARKEYDAVMTALGDRLLEAFPFLETRPSTAIGKNDRGFVIQLKDRYATGIQAAYGKLAAACPDSVREHWLFDIVH